jgi:hypothetical protein
VHSIIDIIIATVDKHIIADNIIIACEIVVSPHGIMKNAIDKNKNIITDDFEYIFFSSCYTIKCDFYNPILILQPLQLLAFKTAR